MQTLTGPAVLQRRLVVRGTTPRATNCLIMTWARSQEPTLTTTTKRMSSGLLVGATTTVAANGRVVQGTRDPLCLKMLLPTPRHASGRGSNRETGTTLAMAGMRAASLRALGTGDATTRTARVDLTAAARVLANGTDRVLGSAGAIELVVVVGVTIALVVVVAVEVPIAGLGVVDATRDLPVVEEVVETVAGAGEEVVVEAGAGGMVDAAVEGVAEVAVAPMDVDPTRRRLERTNTPHRLAAHRPPRPLADTAMCP